MFEGHVSNRRKIPRAHGRPLEHAEGEQRLPLVLHLDELDLAAHRQAGEQQGVRCGEGRRVGEGGRVCTG